MSDTYFDDDDRRTSDYGGSDQTNPIELALLITLGLKSIRKINEKEKLNRIHTNDSSHTQRAGNARDIFF